MSESLNFYMHIRRHFLLISVLAFLLAACSDSQSPNAYHLSGNTMGTTFNITIVGEELLEPKLIYTALDNIESTMSTYRLDSELMQLNSAPINTWLDVSSSLYEVLLISEEISEMTDGAFDITVSPLVNLWGFGPDKRENSAVPNSADIHALMPSIGFDYLLIAADREAVLKKAMINLDLSAIAKGYAVDVLSELLEENNISNYLIEIGGEIKTKGHNTEGELWRVAIEAPLRSTLSRNALQIIELNDRSLASSGDYRNFIEIDGRYYSHTIDPASGYPVNHDLASVTVIAESSATADAIATAFSVMGVEKAITLANNRHIPAYFILYKADGFAESYSEDFAPFLTDN